MRHISLLSALLLLLLLSSCKSEYEQYVNSERNSGLNVDSLIFDMHIGQTRKDFFNRCWTLNKENIITAGSGNQSAKYILNEDNVSDKMIVQFYGIFDKEDIMQGMEMTYAYSAWSPWNKDLHSDRLVDSVKSIIINDYGGNDFLTINLKEVPYKAYVKIDGNRHITVYPVNDKDVNVKIEDLDYKFNK